MEASRRFRRALILACAVMVTFPLSASAAVGAIKVTTTTAKGPLAGTSLSVSRISGGPSCATAHGMTGATGVFRFAKCGVAKTGRARYGLAATAPAGYVFAATGATQQQLNVTVVSGQTVPVAITLKSAPLAAGSSLGAVGAITDNYKTVWNPDPNAPDLRTHVLFDALTVGETTFDVASAAPRFTGTPELALTGGAVARVIALDPAQTKYLQFRVISEGQWGVFFQLVDREALKAAPVRFRLDVTQATGATSSLPLEYRYDAAVASSPKGSLEYNNGGGRWYVDGVAASLDHE